MKQEYTMIKKVEQYISQYHMIDPGDRIVAGVSGGADSVCLLLLLSEYREICPFQLAVCHVNHMIRTDARKDAEFVRNLCEQKNIPFHLYEYPVEKLADQDGISTEEEGRKLRYTSFETTLKLYGETGKIAVAHNQNDCAETMLFHLFRGTGMTGMAGILPKRDNIIRPILCLDRQTIEAYLVQNKVSWCIDSTNGENTYTRNKIRNVILPYAEKEICRNTTQHLANAAKEAGLIRDFLEKQTQMAMQESVIFTEVTQQTDIPLTEGMQIETQAVIDEGLFLKLEPLLQNYVLLEVLKKLTNGRKDITSGHIADITSLFSIKRNRRIHLPYNLEAVREYDRIIIRCRDEKKDAFLCELQIGKKQELPNGDIVETTFLKREETENIPEKRYTKWFDYDKIINCLMLRQRQTGDYLTVNEALQKKSLKEYMIQEKIPQSARNSTFLLADGSHILWVMGYRISTYYKVTNNTERILEVKVTPYDLKNGRES